LITIAAPGAVSATFNVQQAATSVACTSFTVTQSLGTVVSSGLISFDVRPLPTGCLWFAMEGDAIPFDGAVEPQTPWTFTPRKVFAGNQVLIAQVFNNPGNQNPTQSPLLAGIDFRGSDVTGTIVSGVLKQVAFTITR